MANIATPERAPLVRGRFLTHTSSVRPQVWVCCLECSTFWENGQWFNAVDAPLDMATFDLTMSAEDHFAHDGKGHEELWVYDISGFGGLLTTECSPADARTIGAAVELFRASLSGTDFAALVALRNHDEESFNADGDAVAQLASFRALYEGTFADTAQFAAHWLEVTYGDDWVSQHPALRFISAERVAHELLLSSHTAVRVGDGVAVFRNR